MPKNTVEQYRKYLEQACINEKLVLHLDKKCSKNCFYSWIFVTIFYSAMHYFNALLSYKGIDVPKKHRNKNSSELGGLDIARNSFYTNKNNITDSIGGDYGQLFQWSWDVRYNPNKIRIPKREEVIEALKILDIVKMIVFNEIGFSPTFNKKGGIILERASREFIDRIYAERKKRLNMN